MNYSDDYKIKGIISKISKELGIPENKVLFAYTSYWKFIKETIEKLPLKNIETEEEFNNLKVNFNIPSLGKLSTNYRRVSGMNKNINKIKDNYAIKIKED